MDEHTTHTIDNQTSRDNTKTIAGAIIVAGIIIAGAILLRGNGGTPSAQTAQNQGKLVETNLRPVSADEHILGDPNAPIVIVEYSDTECPYCKVFHNTLHQVLAGNTNVALVFRHYPIASLHPKAFHEAEATECAWDQGGNSAFWKYLDEVFARTESNNKLDVAELPKIAQDIGLDVPAFNVCLSSGKFAEKIQADMKEPGNVGTPYSVILTKKDISTETRNELAASLFAAGQPQPISFSSNKKNALTFNGALPADMVDFIFATLLK